MPELAAGAGQGARAETTAGASPDRAPDAIAERRPGQGVDVHLLEAVHQLGVQVVVVQVVHVSAGVDSCAASPVVRLRRKSRRMRASTGLARQAMAPAVTDSARTVVRGVGGDDQVAGAGAVAPHPAEHRRAGLPGIDRR